MSGETHRSAPPPFVLALTIWIAMVALVGVGGALARSGTDGRHVAAATTTTTTTKTHVAHAAPSTSSISSPDLSAALADLSSFGYEEVNTPYSGAIDPERFASMVAQSGKFSVADATAMLRIIDFKGAYFRASLDHHTLLVAEQFVFDIDPDAADSQQFIDGFMEGAGSALGDAEEFTVPIDGARGFTTDIGEPDGVAHPAAIVEHALNGLWYLEIVVNPSSSTAVTPDAVITIAQAQIDHG